MDRDDIQGIVLDGYRGLPFARYHVLSFGAGEPRQVLGRLVTDISSGAEPRATSRLQFALTASGLSALGVPQAALSQFSREFRQGMAHPERSLALGDVAGDGPENWEFGGPNTPALDALCMTFAVSTEQREALSAARERHFERFGLSFRSYDALALPGEANSSPLIRERRFRRRTQPPLGEFVLGERDAVGERTRGPFVPVKYGSRPMPAWSRSERALNFGQNGSYLVVRQWVGPAALDGESDSPRALGADEDFSHRLLGRSRQLAGGSWFMALNASIRRQFEFLQQGERSDAARRGRVRGGAYLFLPGIRALNYLAEPGG